jgi:hypothetical protein
VRLSGTKRKRVCKALLDAFPRKTALDQVVSFGLNENLDSLVAAGPLNEQVFDLVRWAETQNRLPDLMRAARSENPGNEELRTCIQELFPTLNDTAPARMVPPVKATGVLPSDTVQYRALVQSRSSHTLDVPLVAQPSQPPVVPGTYQFLTAPQPSRLRETAQNSKTIGSTGWQAGYYAYAWSSSSSPPASSFWRLRIATWEVRYSIKQRVRYEGLAPLLTETLLYGSALLMLASIAITITIRPDSFAIGIMIIVVQIWNALQHLALYLETSL